VAILRHEGIEDAGEARRIVTEWAAMTARSSDCDPVSSLVWACRNRLTATEDGDQRLTACSWAGLRLPVRPHADRYGRTGRRRSTPVDAIDIISPGLVIFFTTFKPVYATNKKDWRQIKRLYVA